MSDITRRQLNALVYQHIFGFHVMSQEEMRAIAIEVWREQPDCHIFSDGFHVMPKDDAAKARGFNSSRPHDVQFVQRMPDYCGSIGNSWDGMRLVVEKMYRDGWLVSVHNSLSDTARFECEFDNGSNIVRREHAFAPVAVCLAALTAKGIIVTEVAEESS